MTNGRKVLHFSYLFKDIIVDLGYLTKVRTRSWLQARNEEAE
jgi:hypothetical protein